MPDFHVEKSIEIEATASLTRRAIQDYNRWSIWSPWLCMEPSAAVTVHGEVMQQEHAYSWEGDMIGSGQMEYAGSDGDTDHMNLTFLKPFKSKAKIKFETSAVNETTSRVTWHMESSLPFFLFFMVSTMKILIGMDYERGLRLLKEYIETGKVTSASELVGIESMPAIQYVGVSAESPLSELSSSMKSSFAKLQQSVEGENTAQRYGAIYPDMNIKTQHCKYIAFAQTSETDAKGTIKPCRAVKVVHKGSYQHLGNAWATANTFQRHKKLKREKHILPFELYINHPDNTPAEDLITEIYLPVTA